MVYRLILILILLTVHFVHADAAENGIAQASEPKLQAAFTLLSQTASGREELKKAQEMKVGVSLGLVSKTDITATRTVSGDQEELVFQTHVVVAADKDPVFQALDLAHELIHATNPKKNPFDPNLNLADYVKHGIEGEGGEAQAIAQECSVGKELIEDNKSSPLKNETVQTIKARCQFVWKMAGDQSRWRHSFYQLGQHYREFMRNLALLNLSPHDRSEWKEKVEPKSPLFASAVAHKPYPLALLEEYVDITHRICDKTKKSGIARNLASIPLLAERCKSIGVDL